MLHALTKIVNYMDLCKGNALTKKLMFYISLTNATNLTNVWIFDSTELNSPINSIHESALTYRD